MKFNKSVLSISLAMAMGSAHAITPVQVTSNSQEDAQPQIVGDAVVWQSQVDGNWEIYHYSLSSGVTTRITTNSFNDIAPKTDGNYITWLANNGSGDINYYEISSMVTSTVPELDGTIGNGVPQIANGRIAWSAMGEVYVYDIASAVTTNLSTVSDPTNQKIDQLSNINDTMLLWAQDDDQGTLDPDDDVTTMMLHDFSTGVSEVAAADFIWPDSALRDGDLSVSSKSDSNDREIYLKHSKGTTVQVTDNMVDDTMPGISGNSIVWVNDSANAAEIYVATDADTDGDGVTDSFDNCINTPNADQLDSNSNNVGDACEAGDAGALAVISSPVEGSQLGTTGSFTINWNDVGATEYGVSHFISGDTAPTAPQQTTTGTSMMATWGTADTLQVVVPMTLRLYTKVNGEWQYVDHEYMQATPQCIIGLSCDASVGGPADILSPAPSSTLSGSDVTFTWTDVGSKYHYLYVGTSYFQSNYYKSPLLTNYETSHAVTGLPTNGQTLYVTFATWNAAKTTYEYKYYTYTAANDGAPPDTTPDQFTFADVTGAELDTSYSSTITVSGINAETSVSVVSGEYRIGLGAWRTTAGIVNNGDTVTVRRNSASSYSQSVLALVTIGGVQDTFNITTKPEPALPDTTPDQFTFTDKTNAELNTSYSSSISVTGINTATPISISGGEYRIGSGAWTSAAGTVTNNQTVYVRRNSSASYSQTVSATVTIGGVSDSFDITTKVETAGGPAQIISPVPGSTLSSNEETFTWNNVGSTYHYLYVGTGFQGSANIYNSGALRNTSTAETISHTVSVLPIAGETIYITLGTWNSNTMTYDRTYATYKATSSTVPDSTPNQFTFFDKNNAELNTSYSASISVVGINVAAPISVAGGEYRIGSGAWTSAAGTVNNGQTVTVRRNSSTAYEQMVSATLTIGGVSDTFSITTKSAPVTPDTTPDPFTFTDRSNAEVNTSYSASVTVKGINDAAPISVSGGEYRIGGGAWTSAAGTVTNNQVVYVRRNSSASYSQTVSATVTIGGVSDSFDITTKVETTGGPAEMISPVTGSTLSGSEETFTWNNVGSTYHYVYVGTGFKGSSNIHNSGALRNTSTGNSISYTVSVLPTNGETIYVTLGTWNSTLMTYERTYYTYTAANNGNDTMPDQFRFVDQTNAELNTSYSSSITVTGINAAAPISVSGGEYRIDSGAWTTVAGTVNNGQVVSVRRNSSTVYGQTQSAMVNIGGVLDMFSITTKSEPVTTDTTPDPFTFVDQTNAELNTSYSASITVSGINAAAPISVSGGEYRIGSGAWTTAAGTVNNGQVVSVRRNSSTLYSQMVSASVNIGGVSDTFSITTKSEPVTPDTTPDPFTFVDQTSAELNTSYSASITVSGINAATPISVSGGEYRIGSGAWTTAAGTVNNGQVVSVRRNSSALYSQMVSASVTIGGVSDTFSITTKAEPVTGVAAELITPSSSSIMFLNGDTAFTWQDVGADEYAIAISGENSNPAIPDLDAVKTTNTSITTPVSDGSFSLMGPFNLYIRLYSRFGNEWVYRDYNTFLTNGIPLDIVVIM